uniref:Uncharacterized protein n=1 Tax=Helianthus annuus TaxID=4232 RepID=A0A251RSG6_HELAN
MPYLLIFNCSHRLRFGKLFIPPNSFTPQISLTSHNLQFLSVNQQQPIIHINDVASKPAKGEENVLDDKLWNEDTTLMQSEDQDDGVAADY